METKAWILVLSASAALALALPPGCNAVSGVSDYAFDRACADAVVAKTEDCSTPTIDENCDTVLTCAADDLWSVSFGRSGPQHAYGVAFDHERNAVVVGDFEETINLGADAPAAKGGSDIFVAKLSPAGDLIWSKRFGADGAQRAYDVAIDSKDNILIGGSFDGSVTFGDDALTASSGVDLFVAKLSASGGHLWSKSYPGDANQWLNGVAVDSSDNILLTGSFEGKFDFGDNGALLQSTNPATLDVFVAKLSPDGRQLWSSKYGDGSDQVGRAIAAGPEGVFYVGGSFQGSLGKVGAESNLTSTGGSDAFLIAFNADGGVRWAKGIGDMTKEGSSTQEVSSLSTDTSGNLLVAGDFEGTLGLGEAITSKQSRDIFLAKLSGAGGTIWVKSFGSSEDEASPTVATDGADNVVLSGAIQGTVDFGIDLVEAGPMPTRDVFIAKFFGNGKVITAPRFTNAGDQVATRIAADSLGNIAIVGAFQGSLSFGGLTIPSAPMSTSDAFVALFRP